MCSSEGRRGECVCWLGEDRNLFKGGEERSVIE